MLLLFFFCVVISSSGPAKSFWWGLSQAVFENRPGLGITFKVAVKSPDRQQN